MKKAIFNSSVAVLIVLFAACEDEPIPEVQESTEFAPDPTSVCGSAYYACVGEINSIRAEEYLECARLYGTGGADYYGCINESESDTKEEISRCKRAYDECEQS